MDLIIAGPGTPQAWAAYYQLRWEILREPWGQPLGSERDALETSAYHAMCTDQSGQVLGVGRLHFNAHEEAQIRYMAVRHTHQGKGIGSQIIHYLEQESHRAHVQTIVLNAREQAVAFYQRHAYILEAESETMFGSIRHFRMRKSLG